MLREIVDGPRMKFLVLGRADIMTRTLDVPYIVVSVTDCEAPKAKIAESPQCLDILRLKFHDADVPQSDWVLISEQDARNIVAFIRQHLNTVQAVVCQCEAGMSRSAGIAAALSRWLQDDDTVFFQRYLPNRYVYRRVLEAAQESDRHSSVNADSARIIALLTRIGEEAP
jgi:predicted protein tyrosine phosphatase